ncbi:NUDIX hydrolase [Tsuneonella sp. HG222]
MGLKALAERVLALLPAPIARPALLVASRLNGAWRSIVPNREVACFVAVGNSRQEILLVRHTYRDPELWTLPGGAMHPGEDPLRAAMREVREELSCELSDLELKGFFHWEVPPRTIDGYVVTALTDDIPTPDQREISEAGFFALDALPEPLFDFAQEQIDELLLRTSFTVAVPPFIRSDFVKRHGRRYARLR